MGTRAGVGNFHGVETPRPLVGAQMGARNKKKHQKTPRDGSAQEQVRRKQNGGGKDSRDWIHNPAWDRQGLSHRLRPAGGGGGGGGGSRNGGGSLEPRREHPQGSTEKLVALRASKRGQTDR